MAVPLPAPGSLSPVFNPCPLWIDQFNHNDYQDLAMRLTPLTSYYVCKLLRQNIDNLKWIVAPGAGLQAEPWGNLDAVLTSLYLEEVELAVVVQRIEALVTYHRSLIEQTLQVTDEIAAEVNRAEVAIFWLLGFKVREQVIHHSAQLQSVR